MSPPFVFFRATTPEERRSLELLQEALCGKGLSEGASMLANVLCAGLMAAGCSKGQALHLLSQVWDGMEGANAVLVQPEGRA